MANRIFRVEGDTGPPVTFQQEGVDITGYTANLRLQLSTGARISIAGVIDNAVTGDWSFPFTADPFVRGEHRFDLEIVDGAGVIVSFASNLAFLLSVRKQNG